MVGKKKGVKDRRRIKSTLAARMHSFVDLDKDKTDISLLKLVNYNLLFFIPLMVFLLFALKIGTVYSDYFEASPGIIAKVFMVPFMALLFFFIIPFIRDREKIAGIRYSIIAFFIIGIGMTLPSALKGDYSLLFTIPNYFGSYILITFIFCPEVLGIERTLRDWFEHRKQLSIVAIYLSIVLLYVIGFGTLYYDIYTDPANPAAFSLSVDKEPGVPSFIYYSMVSFTTTGYGEILPVSTAARLVFFMEALLGLVVNVLFIAILLVFISNAEFLSQRREEVEIEREVKKEEKVLKKEEAEIKKVEKEIKEVEREEGLVDRILNVFVPKK
ncbi:potassium channel family protein [Candidatus Woesearchaeota archaeon]|nr:potassium channel family protein [Candidatus Woesearchaeota archaeon]